MNEMILYILIKCEEPFDEKILDELKSMQGIKEICRTFGAYDVLVKFESPTLEHHRDIIPSKIRTTYKIRSIQPLKVMPEHKNLGINGNNTKDQDNFQNTVEPNKTIQEKPLDAQLTEISKSEIKTNKKSNFVKDFLVMAIISIFIIWPMIAVAMIQLIHHRLHLNYSYLIAEGIWGAVLGFFVIILWLDNHDKSSDPDPF